MFGELSPDKAPGNIGMTYIISESFPEPGLHFLEHRRKFSEINKMANFLFGRNKFLTQCGYHLIDPVPQVRGQGGRSTGTGRRTSGITCQRSPAMGRERSKNSRMRPLGSGWRKSAVSVMVVSWWKIVFSFLPLY
jgi:hypothetical protein